MSGAPAEKPRADHCVLDFKTSELHCLKCDAREPVKLPISLSLMVARTDTFIEAHKGCA